jgi:hypothetical protein
MAQTKQSLLSKRAERTHMVVEIHGPSKIVYGGNDKPLLPCGARVVIETEAEVTIK